MNHTIDILHIRSTKTFPFSGLKDNSQHLTNQTISSHTLGLWEVFYPQEWINKLQINNIMVWATKWIQYIYHFTDGASFRSSFLTTGCAEVCVHETHLSRDGLREHWQSSGVTSLLEQDWWGSHTQNVVQSF